MTQNGARHSGDQRNCADQDASARHAELAGLQPAQTADGAALTKAMLLTLCSSQAVQLWK